MTEKRDLTSTAASVGKACTELSSEPTGHAPTRLLLGKNDAAVEAALVVRGIRSGVRAVIEACVRTNDTIRRFSDDPDSIDAFLAVLVDGNVISPNEARLGKASPKLVKLCAIGAHRGLLTRDEVFQYLEPGYTVLYQVIVLYNTLQGDENDRFEKLVQILHDEGTASRETLSDRTAAIKRAKRNLEIPPAANDNVRPEGDISRSFDLALLTLDHQIDRRRLGEDYADRPRFCQLAHGLLAEEATAIVIARVTDLPLIENKLLPMLGFTGPSHVFLVRAPTGSNVTEAEVLVFTDRRKRPFVPDFEWLAFDDSFDPNLIAEQLVPDSKRRLHLFARKSVNTKSGYWLAIVGDGNWSHADE
jgi:hypothetical protein